MRVDEYQTMYDMESKYWWHKGRQYIIGYLLKKHLPKSDKSVEILDLGCGTGINFDILQNFGKVKGVDISSEALNFCKKRGITDVYKGDILNLKLPKSSFDAVTAFDILEHINDDERALKNIYNVLKPGGIAFVLSPAYQFLWSEHDEALHHKRRYMLSEMHRKMTRAGFKMRKRSYCITFLSAPIFVYRLLASFRSSKKPSTSYVMLPGWLNSIFAQLLRLEGKLLQGMNFPFGISILCIAEKK